MKFDSKIWVLITSSFCCLVVFFHRTILHPYNFLNKESDSLKNYFTLEYYLKYSEKLLWFDGMNYPFGEHISFTDAQPLLAWILYYLKDFTEVNSIFTINTLILISIFITPLILFKTFELLGYKSWEFIFFSILITYMSPQIIRFLGHYSLSYIFYIPLNLYLLVRYTHFPNKRYLAGLGLIILFSGLIHPYYTFISATIFTSFFFSAIIGSKYKKESLHLLVTTILTSIICKSLIDLTDPVLDRTTSPYGLFSYSANLYQTFLPLGLKLHPLNFLPNIRTEFESTNFLGFGAIIGLIIGIKKYKLKPIGSFEHIWLICSLITFVISLDLPFHLLNSIDVSLLEWLGPLRQFRSLGRLGWIFYYMGTIYGFSQLYNWMSNKKPVIKLSIFALLLLDMVFINLSYSVDLSRENECFGSPNIGMLNTISLSDFDAILPLPYYHVGSENFVIENDPALYQHTLKLAINSGIPLASVQLSRTSVQQSFANVKLSYGKPDSVHLFHNYLVIADTSLIKNHERKILNQSTMIGTWKDYLIYSYKPSKTEIDEANPGNQKNGFVQKKELNNTKLSPGVVSVSLWIHDINRDLIPKTIIKLIQHDEEGENIKNTYQEITRNILDFSGTRGFVKMNFEISTSADYSFIIQNTYSQDSIFYSDFNIQNTTQ